MVDLIRNRPVFNKDLLKEGIAIKFRHRDSKNCQWTSWHHALIMDVSFSDITLAKVEDEYVEELEFTIEEVTDEELELELLK